MGNRNYISIYPGLSVIAEQEPDNIYPAGIIRIVVRKKHMKISCGFEFSIAADILRAQESAKSIDWDGNIDHIKMAEKYRIDGGEYRITATDKMIDLAEEISSIVQKKDFLDDDQMRIRLRVIELIGIIDRESSGKGQQLPASEECSPYQAKIARAVYSYLMKHMDEHITIENLSEIFGVSKTQLKEGFKNYYGESVFSYIRKEKILIAAHTLQKTDKPVSNIAKMCGYASVSKFSSAFFKVMDVTPSKYRSMV